MFRYDECTRHETFRHLSVEIPVSYQNSSAPTELAALLARFFAPEVGGCTSKSNPRDP